MATLIARPSFDFGLLEDISDVASAAGFSLPMALTQNLVERFIEPPEKLTHTFDARLRNLIRCLRMSVDTMGLFEKMNRGSIASPLFFTSVFRMAPKEFQEVTLKAVCGVDLLAKPVVVVMLPDGEQL